MISRNLVAVLAGVTLPFTGSPAVAQASDEPAAESNEGLGDIVVTARKREESLISVPVAVTVLGSQVLERYNAASLQDIGRLAPQLVITTAPSGSGASLSIRGIGSVAEDPGVDQSVGVYLDNVGVSRGRIIGISMFDIAQVEVLKGPQALFFGKNSPAGVVSLTSAGPGREFEGKVLAGYEFVSNEGYVEAAAGGPVSDTFGIRVAARASGMDGFIRNLATPVLDPLTGLTTPGANNPRSPRERKFAGRLTLQFDPTSDLRIVAKVLGASSRTNDPSGTLEHKCLPGVTFAVAGVPVPAEDCTLNRRTFNTGINPALAENWPHANGGELYGKTNLWSGSLAIDYTMGNLALTSVTGASRLEYHDLFNASVSPYQALIPQSNELTKTLSQELRLNSDFDGALNFTVGGYYEHTTRKSPNSVAILFVGPDLRTGQPRNWNFTREANNRGTTLSAFGQVRWNILENLELAGGIRYTHDKKAVRLGNSFVNPAVVAAFGPAFILPEGNYLNGSFKDSDWSPEATLTWHPTPDQTVYAAYKTGYKSGGFSNTLLLGGTFTIDDLTYDPESTEGGEVGYKANLFDGKVRVELAAYRYKFKGLQLSAFDAATFSYFIRNAAAARTTGVELSTQWRATRELTLRGDVAYNEAKFLNYPGAPCYQTQTPAQGCIGGTSQNPAGKQLPRAPEWTLNLGGTYEVQLSDRFKLGLDADARYNASFYTDPALTPFIRQSGFWLLNAAVRLSSADDAWELSVIGRNLTNQIYVNYATDPGLAPVGVWTLNVERGRQVAVQAKINF